MKKHIKLWLLLVVLCVSIIVAPLMWKSKNHTALDTFMYTIEDVSKISLSYQEYTVYLTEKQVNDLINMFKSAEVEAEGRENNIPFHTCPYKLTLWTEHGKYPVEICWFDGVAFDLDVNHSTVEVLDNRFDMKIESKWYTFRQTSETRWNSLILQDMFERLALEQNIDVTPTFERDGYDGEVVKYNDYPKGYQYIRMSADDIIRSSDYVIIGTFLRNEEMDQGTYVPLSSKQIVKVEDVLKGSLSSGDEISIKCDFYEQLTKNNTKVVNYTHVYDPMMVEGEEYLLCLNYETNWGTEENPYGIYVIEGGVYGSATVIEGYTYPRFNTEYHPFYKVSIQMIQDYCNS